MKRHFSKLGKALAITLSAALAVTLIVPQVTSSSVQAAGNPRMYAFQASDYVRDEVLYQRIRNSWRSAEGDRANVANSLGAPTATPDNSPNTSFTSLGFFPGGVTYTFEDPSNPGEAARFTRDPNRTVRNIANDRTANRDVADLSLIEVTWDPDSWHDEMARVVLLDVELVDGTMVPYYYIGTAKNATAAGIFDLDVIPCENISGFASFASAFFAPELPPIDPNPYFQRFIREGDIVRADIFFPYEVKSAGAVRLINVANTWEDINAVNPAAWPCDGYDLDALIAWHIAEDEPIEVSYLDIDPIPSDQHYRRWWDAFSVLALGANTMDRDYMVAFDMTRLSVVTVGFGSSREQAIENQVTFTRDGAVYGLDPATVTFTPWANFENTARGDFNSYENLAMFTFPNFWGNGARQIWLLNVIESPMDAPVVEEVVNEVVVEEVALVEEVVEAVVEEEVTAIEVVAESDAYVSLAQVDAAVTRLQGNRNLLTVTAVDTLGAIGYTTVEIANNASVYVTLNVGGNDYTVFIETRGNDQVRSINW